jgi:hypothetical protein
VPLGNGFRGERPQFTHMGTLSRWTPASTGNSAWIIHSGLPVDGGMAREREGRGLGRSEASPR